MRAVGLTTFGGPDVLRLLDLPEPVPGPGEVRIRVQAAAVTPSDTLIRAGLLAHRLADEGVEPPYIPGWDAAGVVDAVGPGGDGRLSVGDAVVAFVRPIHPCKGSYADLIVRPAASVVRAPSGSAHEASTLIVNGVTAHLALGLLALEPGQTLGVTGAAGAFGGFVVQLAAHRGLVVVADAAPGDVELVRRLGAHHVVARGPAVSGAMRAVAPDGVDGLVDAALQNELVLGAVVDEGRVVSSRGWTGPAPRGIEVRPVSATPSSEDTALLTSLVDLADAGVLSLRVADVLPLVSAAAAHRRLEAGGVRGRLVLDLA
ncbi:NADP-dependent oxidoreductase [Longivirga aurantiaca]|uniref:NADP-dependent oxidoreductase n=1 Tax=Longivirga aurantiaca TaxID=1837743 RepID=A0ABW1T3D8_9ACTN